LISFTKPSLTWFLSWQKQQAIEPLRIGDGVRGGQNGVGGGNDAAQVGPVTQSQIGTVLQLVS
jgi:hypothetical protein